MRRSVSRSRTRARAGLALALALGTPVSAAEPAGLEAALARLFPPPATVDKQVVFLTDAQASRVALASGVAPPSRIVTRFAGRTGDVALGRAYLDTHLVRSLSETLLIALAPDGSVRCVEVVAFHEPLDYRPPARWFQQFEGRRLGAELELKRSIRTLAGATLSSRAATDAVRRVLALERGLSEEREP